MPATFKQLTDFLVNLGIDEIAHTQKNYLAHLISVYKLMQARGCDEELCRAGLFHSIYGTEKFQGFKLPLTQRAELAELIGSRAERLAYWNCVMDRSSLDALLAQENEPLPVKNRETGEMMPLTRRELDDLCCVHLFDWLEQAPRSRFGWDYRRQAYRQMAERLGGGALAAYEQVFAGEPNTPSPRA
ncbi:MAG: hypothetical protein L0211_13395 [Planctomycetaceae bacterium]|nr:hypothetical protein [Planctomycetaceae bacterium]